MHIPDGYLSPQTYLPLYGVFISFVSIAVKKIKKNLSVKLVPFLGMASAFSFLIMMFNIPIPGGTTGHAVGAALIALMLGPWVAVVSVSVAVILQALIFGDGGITAIGANCFNMAIVMSFVAYGVFKLVGRKTGSIARMTVAAFLAGYISLCVAAVITGVEFGIQPFIAVSPQGLPLYSPYPLKVAVPVMAAEHLLVFGVVEGVVTALLFRYFYKNNPEMINVIR
ncbi:MAG: cobalt transporter CbiM [Bacteroidota bacterium]|nr:cobalt transporter CbiM [Bacteroidota bacterium]